MNQKMCCPVSFVVEHLKRHAVMPKQAAVSAGLFFDLVSQLHPFHLGQQVESMRIEGVEILIGCGCSSDQWAILSKEGV